MYIWSKRNHLSPYHIEGMGYDFDELGYAPDTLCKAYKKNKSIVNQDKRQDVLSEERPGDRRICLMCYRLSSKLRK